MEKVLSQEEVDALLKGVSDGNIETEAQGNASPADIRSYDLTNQDRIIRGRMPTMEIINDRFSREASASLFRFLGRMAEVKMESFESIKYGEFLKKLPSPVSLSLFRTEPFLGTSLFFVDSGLIFLIVDILFGGRGRLRENAEERDFTAMENRIIRRLIDLFLGNLQKAWSVLEKMTFSFVRSEQNPQFANFIAPSDIVLATTFQIQLEWERAHMGYCIPYSTVEPVKDRLYGRYLSEYAEIDQTMRKRISGHLTHLPLELSVQIGTVTVSLRDLLRLKTGDVLRLDASPQDPHLLKIQDVVKGTCVAGQRNGSYAVELLSIQHQGREKEEDECGTTTGPRQRRDKDGLDVNGGILRGNRADPGT